MGAAILEKFFPLTVTEPVRWHVDAKRYLCAVDRNYFSGLSDASVKTLELQGGPLNQEQIKAFENNPYLETIIRLRRYDDQGKVSGVRTRNIDYYLEIAETVLV